VKSWRRRRKYQPDVGEKASSIDAGHQSIKIGRDNLGIASMGDYTTNILTRADHATVLPPEAFKSIETVEATPNLTNLPARTASFIGRAEELAQLESAVTAGPDSNVRVVVQAVHGLGGIGKSALAAHYAATYGRRFNPVWWITADSPAGLDMGLATLAGALQPTLTNLLPIEVLREHALQWLAVHTNWLIVLDNVTDIAHIEELVARAATGRFIVTSRRTSGWHGIATPVRLDVFTSDEAEQLLTKIIFHSRQPTQERLIGVNELCAELGNLPLAIEQAGAYIAETGITPADYLALLAAYPASMYREAAEHCP
jgi:hypothetical protein